MTWKDLRVEDLLKAEDGTVAKVTTHTCTGNSVYWHYSCMGQGMLRAFRQELAGSIPYAVIRDGNVVWEGVQ